MTTPFKELAGSPRESFGPDGMTAQRRIVVAWEDRHAMIAELLGEGYAFGSAGCTAYPGFAGIAAMQAKVEPWPETPDDQGPQGDVAVQLNGYAGKFALVTIDYEWLDQAAGRGDLPAVAAGTWLTYRMDFGGERIALAGEALRWQSNAALPVPAGAAPLVYVPIIEHHITWHRVALPPWEAIRALSGTVNGSGFLGAAPETVLFDGAAAVKQYLGTLSGGRPATGWKLSYVFREKALYRGASVYGWNHHYRSVPQDMPGWDRLIDGVGATSYPTGDFLLLFQG